MNQSDGALDLIDEMIMEEEEDMTGKWIWVRHPEQVWARTQVVSMVFDEEDPNHTKEFLVQAFDSPDALRKVLVRDVHRVDPTHDLDLDDVCLMNDMHEGPLLDLLRRRFALGKIYTYSGDVLISINPCERMPSAYEGPMQFFSIVSSSGVMKLLQESQENARPHVYQIANRALSSLAESIVSSAGNGEQSTEPIEGNTPVSAHRNQSVIISGESGAGKTENSKYVVRFFVAVNSFFTAQHNHLLNAEKKDDDDDSFAVHLQHMLEQSSTILEAFGNAKTARNDNSSRFGKYTKLFYHKHLDGIHSLHPYPKLICAQIETFLLEKSRLAVLNDGERCFHILHQLQAGLAEHDSALSEDLCMNKDMSSFRLLAKGAGVTSIDDARQFLDTIAALRAVNCSEEEINAILSLLAALLHLGNIVLNDGRAAEDEGSGGEIVKLDCPTMPLESLAALLGLQFSTFKLSLTMQQLVIARRASLKVKILSPSEVANNISALVKLIYSQTFDWLVKKMNISQGNEHYFRLQEEASQTLPFIGILDIFGFEILTGNSFEQLCINFTNERLQQQFNQHVFITEQEMYRREGLFWDDICFRDNQPIIDVIAGTKKPTLGLLLLIEEQGMLNRKPDDTALMASFNQIHDSSMGSRDSKTTSLYARHKTDPRRFTLRHFAGDVTYCVDGFLAKNNDTLQSDLMKLMMSTTNVFLRNVMKFPDCAEGQCGFVPSLSRASSVTSSSSSISAAVAEITPLPSRPTAASVSAAKKLASSASVSSQFRMQLDSLMSNLNQTQPHYIKCIKPNAALQAKRFEAALVNQQLCCSGVLEVVRIRREGFPLRLSFHEFYKDYEILAKGKSREDFPDPSHCSFEDAKRCSIALASDCLRPDQYQIGDTLIFLRENGRAMMIDAIKALFHKKVSRVQALFKTKRQREWFLTFSHQLIKLQAKVKAFVRRNRFLKMKSAIAIIKQYLAAKVLRLQFIRKYSLILEARKTKSAIQIQRIFRGFQARTEHQRRMHAAVMIQKHFRGFQKRLWLKNVELLAATVAIQSAVRRYFACKKAAKRARAATIVQSFARMCLVRFDFAQAIIATVRTQAVVRRFLSRNLFLKKKAAAVRIQSFIRRVQAFRLAFLHVAAVWLLQSTARRWLTQRRFLRQRSAAIVVQKYTRRFLVLRRQRGPHEEVLTLQRFLRGSMARRRFQIQLRSVVLLQSFVRMAVVRANFYVARFAVVKIQSLWRCRISRKNYLARKSKVIVAQAVVRRYLERKKCKHSNAAITKIQSIVRMILKKNHFQKMRLAAVRLQTIHRSHSAKRAFARVMVGICRFQALFRCVSARNYRKRATHAVISMQSFARMLSCRKKYQVSLQSSILLQKMIRGRIAQLRYRLLRQKLIVLQSWMKMLICKRNYSRERKAVLTIQCGVRRFLAQSRLRLALQAAVTIQSHCRRSIAQRRFLFLRAVVVRLQAFVRLVVARNLYMRMQHAQKVIAKNYRGFTQRLKFRRAVFAVRLLQRCVRNYMSRLKYLERLQILFIAADSSKATIASSPASLLAHLEEFPADRKMRFASHDLCTLVHSLILDNRSDSLESIHITVAETLDVDKFSRNSAHYVAMYPSMKCFNVIFELLGAFKDDSGSATPAVMALDEDDDNDNDDDDDGNNNSLDQLKLALNNSVDNSTLKEGWLKKKRGGWSWQKRWFVLTEDYIIYYKTPQSTDNPKFAIPIHGCSIQRAAGTKEPIFELSSENMAEKKKLFGGTKNTKTLSILAENEKELQEWLTPLRAMAGVNVLRTEPPVKYIHTELCQLWAAAVDKNLETPLHLLVRYHCVRQRQIEAEQKKPRRLSLIRRIRQSITGKQGNIESTLPSQSAPNLLKLMEKQRQVSLEETLQVLSWLIDLGCPVNGQNSKGETAFHIALRNGSDERIVRALLLKGADPKSFKDDHGLSAFDIYNSVIDDKDKYSEVFATFTKNNITLPLRGTFQRTFASNTKLKGFSYLSLMIGHQLFDSKVTLNGKSLLSISAFNSSKQLIEASKELSCPLWLNDGNSESVGLFWGFMWHMQTPLENLEDGSCLVIEYKMPTNTSGSFIGVMGTIALDVTSIDSEKQVISLSPSADATSKTNPLMANNEKSTLEIEIIINQRNRAIDYRYIYGII